MLHGATSRSTPSNQLTSTKAGAQTGFFEVAPAHEENGDESIGLPSQTHHQGRRGHRRLPQNDIPHACLPSLPQKFLKPLQRRRRTQEAITGVKKLAGCFHHARGDVQRILTHASATVAVRDGHGGNQVSRQFHPAGAARCPTRSSVSQFSPRPVHDNACFTAAAAGGRRCFQLRQRDRQRYAHSSVDARAFTYFSCNDCRRHCASHIREILWLTAATSEHYYAGYGPFTHQPFRRQCMPSPVMP